MREKISRYAPLTLRLALSFVFLWFGINQIINPSWFMGYIPLWAAGILSPAVILILNGSFEILLGLLLLLGIFVRLSSLLLSAHLFLIGLSLGYNDVAIRDIGLALATFSIFLHGDDKFCLGRKISWLSFKKKEKEKDI